MVGKSEKLDILCVAAHPDDVELSCSGTVLKHIDLGYSVGILDLTRGELGTRGTAETRKVEADKAAQIMGLAVRENAGLPDGFLEATKEQALQIIPFIRRFQPNIVLANALDDRHPDHGNGAKLAAYACFLSGLSKIETTYEGEIQAAWRPKSIYHYIQDEYLEPDFVVDISKYMDKKFEAIKAFKSQFYDPNSSEPVTPISTNDFIEYLRAKARVYGRKIGVEFAEGFNVRKAPGVSNLFDLK